MDVLIDVKDLLSTSTSDEASPLSAPDLRLLIDRLNTRSLTIKSKVRTYIHSHYNHFSLLFNTAQNSLSNSHIFHQNLNILLQTLSQSPDHQISSFAKEITVKSNELREKREILASLNVILGFSDKLESIKECISNGKIIEGAVMVRETKDKKFEKNEPILYGLLRNEWKLCFEEIQDLLVRFMGKAVRLEQKHNTVHVKYFLDEEGFYGIELYTVLEAMDVIGILNYGLAKVVDMIVKFVITQAVNCNAAFVEKIKQEKGREVEAILKLVSSSGHKKELNVESIYSELVKVIQFVYGSVCCRRSEWMQTFGKLTWPRMSELIITNLLSKIVPDDASKIADFQKIIKLTSEFETALKEMMFISGSDNKDDRLSDFTDNVEVHFASRKRIEILAKARNLLLQSDFSLPQDHVVDLLFLPERCVVSKAALQLMELVHQTLKDVCLSSTRVSLEFYNAARDVLLLYEAIVPVKQERQLNGINQVAVLVHNDCLYLSQEILGLAFEYRSDFPDPVKELAVFADMAPRFQLMAEQILQRQIQLVIHNLKEAVDGADGFQNTHQMQQYQSAKFSIEQVVSILEKVHIIWEPRLIPSTYKRSMCTVLEPVFSRMASDILQLDDMAAEETLQLQRLIHMMLESLSSLLDSLNTNTKTEKSKESLARSVDDLIPSLQKIRKLAEMLDIPLKSITEAWESGELVSSGFTLTEVHEFIRAIFADSPLRRECLRRIETAWF